MNNNNEHWLIIGAGAIGLLWYSKLIEYNFKATLLHRNAKLLNKLIVEDGNIEKQYQLNEISSLVSAAPSSSKTTTYQRVLFCTKSFDLEKAYIDNKHRISSDAVLITLNNGMGAQQSLNTIKHSDQSLYIGTTNEGALKVDKNKIRRTGQGDIFIGSLSDNMPPPAPFSQFYTIDIEYKLLTKLAINAVINPLTALFNISNGQLLDESYLPYYRACRDEVCHLFKHYKIDETSLSQTIDQVALKTSRNRSSMLQDFSQGRKTEIQYITGYLLQEATKVNLKLPIQSLLLDFIENKGDFFIQIKKLDKLI